MRKLVLAICLLAACSDDDGGPIEIDDLGGALINRYCDLYVRCGILPDMATCQSLYLGETIDDDLVAAVHAGKVIYHADKAGECLAGVAPSCEARNEPGNSANPEACDATFEGTVAEGGACALDEECVSQECDIPLCQEACCQGTCLGGTPVPRPHVGESCLTDRRCVNSFCDDATNLCTAYLADGAACAESEQCTSYSCFNDVCQARARTGETCGTDLRPCLLIGDHCSDTTMTCTPLGLGGDACTEDEDCSPIYHCETATSTCVLLPRTGESCAETQDCLDRNTCDETTLICVAPKADGQPCDFDLDCDSRHCDATTSTCVTPPVCI
jgi:hypothetical protein